MLYFETQHETQSHRFRICKMPFYTKDEREFQPPLLYLVCHISKHARVIPSLEIRVSDNVIWLVKFPSSSSLLSSWFSEEKVSVDILWPNCQLIVVRLSTLKTSSSALTIQVKLQRVQNPSVLKVVTFKTSKMTRKKSFKTFYEYLLYGNVLKREFFFKRSKIFF